MPQKLLFLILLVALSALLPARAETLTVKDGTATNNNVPIYGLYVDDYLKCEYVIPAEDIEVMIGGTITGLTWYLSSSATSSWGNANFQVFVKEVPSSAISDYSGTSGATIIYQGPLDGTQATIDINFSNPYVYNGGNLLIGVYNTVKGTYKSCAFYGQEVEGASVQGYSSSSLDEIPIIQQNFIPKTSFTYTPGSDPIYYSPKDLSVSNIGANEATVSWTPGSTETSWNVEYKKSSDATWTLAGSVSSVPTLNLDVLENGISYDVRVQADYGSGNLSRWSATSFTTLICEAEDKGEISYSLADSYAGNDGWNGASIQVVHSRTGTVVATLTIPYGSNSSNGTVSLCYGEEYTFVWVSGKYDYECSYTITDPDGEVIVSDNTTAGPVATYTLARGLVVPTNLAVSEITARSAEASWKGNPDIQGYNLRYRPWSTIMWDFEDASQFDEFTKVDADKDGFNWRYYNNAGLESNRMTTHSGDGVVSSESYDNSNEAVLYPDNWLITPKIELGGRFSFWACGQDETFFDEKFGVYVCQGDSWSSVDEFTQVGEDYTATQTMTLYTVDLSDYSGNGFVAIVHHNCYDLFMLNIDDVATSLPCDWVTVEDISSPYTIEGLTPATHYEVQVQAVYTGGESPWTASEEFTTLAVDAMPVDLMVTEETAHTATSTWKGYQESYNLRYRPYVTPSKAWDFNTQDQFSEWTIVDADNDRRNWYYSKSGGHSGGCVASDSWTLEDDGFTPDNWLISPEVPLKGTLTLWACGNSSFPDNFAVYVVVGDGSNVEGYEKIGDDHAPTAWTEYTYDLSQYNGQKGHFAIRHYNCSDKMTLRIDDITLETSDVIQEWVEVDNVTSPYTITGLDAATEYEVQVQGNYDGGTTGWTASALFTTLCEETTLAHLCSTGEEGKTYTIGDQLMAVAYAENSEGSFLWCKDQGDASIFTTTIHEGEQVDFMVQNGAQSGAWDQSNWIALKFKDLTTDEATVIRGYVDSYINAGAITGVLVDDTNYMLEVSTKTLTATSGASYTKNVYSTSNFVLDNLNLFGGIAQGDGAYTIGNQEQNYFFMNPKVQEVCTITYAMWDAENECFTVPSNSGFEGRISVDLAYNEIPNLDLAQTLTDQKVYQFEAVVNRASKDAYGTKGNRADEFVVFPINLTGGEGNIVTAINGISSDGYREVVGVEYVNPVGMVSDKPFQGVNIIVTRYSDGSTTTVKKVFK